MSQTLYHAPGVCSATLDAVRGVITAVWHKFPGDGHFRPSLDAQAAAVAAGKARFVIVDVRSATGVPTLEDQDYLVKSVFPAYKQGGLQAIVTLVPASALTKLGAQRWQDNGTAFGFGMFEAGSPADAEALLAEKYAGFRRAA
jgi:hypothetical protein